MIWGERRSRGSAIWRAKRKRIPSQRTEELLKGAFESGLDALWILDKDGKPIRGGVVCDDQPEDRSGQVCERVGVFGKPVRTLPSGMEVWEAQGKNYLVAASRHGHMPERRVIAPARTSSGD